MELLPHDCLQVICSFIRDREFINFASTSKYFNSLIKNNLKIMTNQHKLSKITNVKDIYIFTNILYDLVNFDFTQIPHIITEITFCDEFNETFDELANLKYLKKINIGMYYGKSLCNNINNLTNQKELVMTIITNKVLKKLFNCDTTGLYVNLDDIYFLTSFRTIYSYSYNNYMALQEEIKTNNVYQLDFITLMKINIIINTTNEHELRYFKNNFAEVSDDYENYMEFLTFHASKMLEYLVKLKFLICEKHENIRYDFVASGDKQLFKLQDVNRKRSC